MKYEEAVIRMLDIKLLLTDEEKNKKFKLSQKDLEAFDKVIEAAENYIDLRWVIKNGNIKNLY